MKCSQKVYTCIYFLKAYEKRKISDFQKKNFHFRFSNEPEVKNFLTGSGPEVGSKNVSELTDSNAKKIRSNEKLEKKY